MGTSATAIGQRLPSERAAGSPRTLARLAGLLYIGIALGAAVAHGYVPAQISVPNDAAATAARVLASADTLRVGIAAEYFILLSEVALSVILYVIFRPVNATLAMTAAAFRLVMTAIHGMNIVSRSILLILIASPDGAAAIAPEQLAGLVQLLLETHKAGFAIGIVFLIPHVFVLGYLIIVSGYAPRLIGGLFLLAGAGYLADSLRLLLTPGYSPTPAALTIIIASAEVAFPLWLLARGINTAGAAPADGHAAP